uniref:hypothetical protein n=1 Tax=Variovorax sp. BK018 TaxID=3450241 RepID=UPI00403A00A0
MNLWPDSSYIPKGLVVVCTTNSLERREFDLQLRALRSDASNIAYFDLASASSEENLRNLGSALQRFDRRPALIIFDGIPRADKRLEAKSGVLFAQFAQDYDCAVLVTTTIEEKLASSPSAVVGRLAICSSASVVFVISKIDFSENQQDEEEAAVLLRVKSTVGPRDEGYGFEIVAVQAELNGKPIPAAVLEWNDTHIYGPLAKRKALQVTQKRYTQRHRAATFLRDILRNGPMPSAAVFRLGGQAQIPEDTLRRAATDVGVIRRAQPGIGGGRGPDLWSLHGHDHLPVQSTNVAPASHPPVSTNVAPAWNPPFYGSTWHQMGPQAPVRDFYREYASAPSSHVSQAPQDRFEHPHRATSRQESKVSEHWQPWQHSMPSMAETAGNAGTPIKDFFAGARRFNHAAIGGYAMSQAAPTYRDVAGESRPTTHAQPAKVADVQQPWQQSAHPPRPAASSAIDPHSTSERAEATPSPSQSDPSRAIKALAKKALQAFEDLGK